jgi:hypothetical protein
MTRLVMGAAIGLLVFASQASAQPIKLTGVVHVQNVGDQPVQEAQWAGTKGRQLRLEGFSLAMSPSMPNLRVEYTCHVQSAGDTAWLTNGSFCGSRGRGLRLEGFAIRLTGTEAAKYDVFYSCHVENKGDLGPFLNGTFCGTRGQSLRLEAMRVWVVPIGMRTLFSGSMDLTYYERTRDRLNLTFAPKGRTEASIDLECAGGKIITLSTGTDGGTCHVRTESNGPGGIFKYDAAKCEDGANTAEASCGKCEVSSGKGSCMVKTGK